MPLRNGSPKPRDGKRISFTHFLPQAVCKGLGFARVFESQEFPPSHADVGLDSKKHLGSPFLWPLENLERPDSALGLEAASFIPILSALGLRFAICKMRKWGRDGHFVHHLYQGLPC